jgi:purine-binding chemotaxis protein CheW
MTLRTLEMGDPELFATFRLDGQRYALPLKQVERVVRAAELTRLPEAPVIVLGVVNVNGDVLPVLNIRRRFNLPEREIGVGDHFLIARTKRRRVVLQIDQVEGITEVPLTDIVCPDQITPRIEQVRGVAKLTDGLLVIHDLESFLSLEEEHALDDALSEEVKRGT